MKKKGQRNFRLNQRRGNLKKKNALLEQECALIKKEHEFHQERYVATMVQMWWDGDTEQRDALQRIFTGETGYSLQEECERCIIEALKGN